MKKVLITGAGRGIGLALTKEFLKHNHQVIATYRDEKSATDLLHLRQQSKDVHPIVADVGDEKTFGALKEKLTQFGPIDILINNAGVIGSKSSSIHELDFKKVSEVFNVNTLGPMRVCQLVMPFMAEGGTVAHITSQMGSISDAGGGYYDYRMSKAALNMFNKCLSIEYPMNTCIVLHPGWVQTDMGGAGAAVTPQESASGLYKVIIEAKPKQTSHFYDFRGREIGW